QWEEPVWKQSEHMDNYASALDKLDQMGLLYPCFSSRSEIANYNEKRDLDLPPTPDGYPVYPNIYRDFPKKEGLRRIEAGNPHTLRLNMPKAMQMAQQRVERIDFQERQSDGSYETIFEPPDAWGDVVLARKDTPTSYTLAVVVDDARQGVTHVTRGEDLYHATSLQRLLQVLLDLPEPLYFHHPLIVDMTGRKLAKSDDDVSLSTIRATGISPQELRAQLPPLLF
ncbi:MAG: glutamate--tRNA ligase family protein, partial [Hyphomicrobiaceae bacterium]|nr:glutamate--tRNA ligase family protein [Hyphomicrobiaceae bacterium]